MISYLREQPRTQALADALRGTAASSGGTQLPEATPLPGSTSLPPPPPDFNQYGDGKEGGGADMGKVVKKGWDTYGDDIMGMFGMSGNAGSAGGAGIGNAASQYGPEVAKMGGNVTSGGWMDGIGETFGMNAGGNGGGLGDLFSSGAGSSIGDFGGGGWWGPLMAGFRAAGKAVGEDEDGYLSKIGGSDGMMGMSLWGDLFTDAWHGLESLWGK